MLSGLKCYTELSPILWLDLNNLNNGDINDINFSNIGKLFGVSIVLNLIGIKELKLEGVPPVVLTDSNLLTEVKINNGSLYSTNPESPLTDYVPKVKLPEITRSKDSNENCKYFFWPLSWSPQIPVRYEYCAPGLIKVDGFYVGTLRLEPWLTESLRGCTEAQNILTIDYYKAHIGPLNITIQDNAIKIGDVIFSESLGFIGDSEHVVFENGLNLDVRLECYSYNIEILHPGGWPTIAVYKGRQVDIKALSIVLNCPKGSAFISSPQGIHVKARPGSLSVLSRGRVIIGSGGHLKAARSLIEVSTQPLITCKEVGIGNVRGGSVAFIRSFEKNTVRMFIWNPDTIRTIFEVRFRRPIKSATFVDPTGISELFVERDLVKILLPPGWMGCLEARETELHIHR